MTSIVAESQSIQKINSDTWMVHFNIQTSVMPTVKFDLTTDHEKEINLIVSNDIYSRIHTEFITRVNSNSCEIKLFSYNGGKELARIAPLANSIGNISYPDIQYTLLSQIEVPTSPQPNTIYMFVIDSYPGLKMVEYDVIRNNLIEQDNEVFMSKLVKLYTEAIKVNSEIKLVFESSVNQAIGKLYSDSIDRVVCDSLKLTRCLGDIIFGRMFGGIQTEFSSIITPNSDWTIVDAFARSKTTQTHKLTIRGSGLAINGNCYSSIGMIMKRTSESITNLKLADINLGTQICEFVLDDESNYPIHPDAINLSKYIELIEYNKTVSQFVFDLNTNPESKLKIKEHMKSNAEYISTIEYDDFNDFAIKEDYLKNIINEKICYLINSIKLYFSSIRSNFQIVNPLDNSKKKLNQIPFQMARGFATELENDLEFDLPCSIANRQSSICTTGCTNKY